MLSSLIQYLLIGISIGAVYALVSIGVTVIFGLTGIVNFAHGQFVMVGAYVMWLLTSNGVGFIVGLLLTFLVLTVVGLFCERFLFRFTLKKPITGFIVSLGLVPLIAAIVIVLWGTDPRNVTPLSYDVWTFGDLRLPAQRAVTVMVAGAMLIALYVIVRTTQVGRSLRAVPQDRTMALALGINVPVLTALTFACATGLAGVAGALAAATYTFTPEFGQLYLLKAFVIALLGGLGSITGAGVVSVGLGIAESLLIGYGLGEWSDALVIVLVIAALLAFPSGLFRGTHGSHV